MTAQIIDGKKLATEIRSKVSAQIAEYIEGGWRAPKLAVILVGDNPASQIYVAHKEKACRACGIEGQTILLPKDITQHQLESEIIRLNQNSCIDGILLQLPLPAHLDRVDAIAQIDPEKDVDGLTPVNQGRMLWQSPGLYPCTPLGVLELIRSTGVKLSGQTAAIVGRSLLVGLPTGQLLEVSGCTILGLHSETPDVAHWTRQADIVVAAAGVHHLIQSNWIKEGAIVIDVGIHRINNRLQGDVDFEAVSQKASFITPVPGGVGPMTIAMLVRNSLIAFERRNQLSANRSNA